MENGTATPSNYSRVVGELRKNFKAGLTKPNKFRESQIRSLLKCLEDHEQDFVDALYTDLRKPKSEAILAELQASKNAAKTALFELNSWTQPVHVSKNALTMLDTVYYYPQPRGVVLIIGPWNFPLNLLIVPLIGAIAAGNCAVIKPSEVSSATAAAVEKFLKMYLDERCYRIVCGGVPESTELLKCQFDHIFYTGGESVAKIVHLAASRHLTPTTFELGGKSPLYLDKTVNMLAAAKRIIWGKCINSGQVCIAPDYILCTRETAEAFVDAAKRVILEFFGDDPQKSSDYGRIINANHFKRLESLMNNTRGTIVEGGRTDEADLFIAPTIILDVSPTDPIMLEEIFGPILPLVYVDSHKTAIEFVKDRPHPLALYVFSTRKSTIKAFREQTTSGAMCVNEVAIHFSVEALPFGGIGPSGMGKYHGKFSFDTFSDDRGVLQSGYNAIAEMARSIRYPPATEMKQNIALVGMEKRRGFPMPSGSSVVGFLTGVVVVLVLQAVIAVSSGRTWWPFE